MFFVLERQSCAGMYFPDKSQRAAGFTATSDLQSAQFFKIEVKSGRPVTSPDLPAGDWIVRHVELRLT